MKIKFIRFKSEMLSAKELNLTLFVIDDEVMISSSDLKQGAEQIVFDLAHERAVSLGQSLWIAELNDEDLISNPETGEIDIKWIDLVYASDFDESEFIPLADQKGYIAYPCRPLDEPDSVCEEIVWSREDVLQALFDNGFKPLDSSVDSVSRMLSELVPDIFKQDVLKSAIWRLAHTLEPL